MKKVCVVIVTYNRKKYLIPLIERLCNQSYGIDSIIVVDNHSEDNTFEALQNIGYADKDSENVLHQKEFRNRKAYYYRMSYNSGGSGGFAKGFELAGKLPADYIWAMDDDVLPENDCLENLLDCMDENAQVALPCRTDHNFTDSACVKYNLHNPFIFRRRKRATSVKSTELKDDITKIESIVFEGPIFSAEVVRKVGIPNADYFIFYDDSDYARRCRAFTEINYNKRAILHKCIIPTQTKALDWRYYYVLRNQFIFDRRYGENIGVKKIRPFLIAMSQVIAALRKRSIYEARIAYAAYQDAVKNKLGKTVNPGGMQEYLTERKQG
ncbi:MAG: glycosyltransferase [Clostridiaceae bacterium]|nr:glycosyltransferase [Clostridiaceae bacterium]